VTLNQSSGDPLADKRFALAEAWLRDREPETAADLIRQAIEIAPDWPAGWFRLGEILEEHLADRAGAGDAFRRAARLDAEDVLGAAARLGRLLPDDPEARMSPAYVARLFDQYSARFDTHLRGQLAYRGPEIVMAALAAACAARGRPMRFATALDLGCGTGLMARAIRDHVGTIDGVDLSSEMVRVARNARAYRSVWVADAVSALQRAASGEPGATRYELLLAADVLCYMKDLTPLICAAAQALTPDGMFTFTVQSGDGVKLGHDLRYHHSSDHVREAASKAGFVVLALDPCATRREGAFDVPGFVVVLGRTDGG
jgi:predicted TPR repeat methyltransferase